MLKKIEGISRIEKVSCTKGTEIRIAVMQKRRKTAIRLCRYDKVKR